MLPERAEVHARFAKTLGDLGGDLWGTGGVAVDAQSVGVQWHLGPVPRDDFSLHDGQGLLRRFGGIENERVGVFAGAQGTVGFIAAVGEGSRTNASQGSTDVVFNALGHKQVRRCQQLLLLEQECAGGVPVDVLETNLVARAKLSEAVQVGGNHVGDLCIAAGGLLFHE